MKVFLTYSCRFCRVSPCKTLLVARVGLSWAPVFFRPMHKVSLEQTLNEVPKTTVQDKKAR